MDGDIAFHSDAVFLLELNLHNVRKELISMLDIYEQTDCLNCYQLKCKCTTDIDNNVSIDNKSDTSKDQSEKSKNNQSDDSKKAPNSVAPPAAFLPKPDFEKQEESPSPSTPEKEVQQDVETWLDAAVKADDDDKIVKETSILALNDNLLLIDNKKTPQVAISYVNNGNAVEAFFKYFKMPSNTAVTYVSAKLACSKPVKQNYTYF